MIEEKNIKRIKMLIDDGLWSGPLLYYLQFDGEGVYTRTAYIT